MNKAQTLLKLVFHKIEGNFKYLTANGMSHLSVQVYMRPWDSPMGKCSVHRLCGRGTNTRIENYSTYIDTRVYILPASIARVLS